jgi:predicted aspartyl protease
VVSQGRRRPESSTTRYEFWPPYVALANAGKGFWFANFTVGSGKNLVLLIDSGSTDVYLNPGVYTPSSTSKDLHQNFTITFETTNPDGSGTETVSECHTPRREVRDMLEQL